MIFKALRTDEVTKGLKTVEEKETGTELRAPGTKVSGQSTHPEHTAQF